MKKLLFLMLLTILLTSCAIEKITSPEVIKKSILIRKQGIHTLNRI